MSAGRYSIPSSLFGCDRELRLENGDNRVDLYWTQVCEYNLLRNHGANLHRPKGGITESTGDPIMWTISSLRSVHVALPLLWLCGNSPSVGMDVDLWIHLNELVHWRFYRVPLRLSFER